MPGSFTEAQRKKALATRRANAEKRKLKATLGEVVSASAIDLSSLPPAVRALVEKLQADVAAADKGRTEAERKAIAAAESQGILGSSIEEQPTGEFREVEVCTGLKVTGHGPDRRPILEPEFKTVRRELYAYKIQLAPSAGVAITVNGEKMYHNSVVKKTIEDLRSIKEMVYRGWDHERNIHGSDENIYRPKSNRHISMRGSA